MKVFAKRLKLARENFGVTQKEAAEILKIPLKTYQKYESLAPSGHREPDQDMLIEMAVALQTSTDFLLGLK